MYVSVIEKKVVTFAGGVKLILAVL